MITLKQIIHYPDTNSVEATWVDADGVQIKCHSYADVQMDMLEADLGIDLPAHAALIATVRANIVPVPPPSAGEVLAALINDITNATQKRLDDFARTRNYDDILSACTYASSTVPKFQSEGQYCVNARDSTWATLYTIMAEVEAGTRPMPVSFADVEPDLPALVWPL
ncbi:MAG: hypothetical protein AB7E55_16010 [Pigmentiphaga sp.]